MEQEEFHDLKPPDTYAFLTELHEQQNYHFIWHRFVFMCGDLTIPAGVKAAMCSAFLRPGSLLTLHGLLTTGTFICKTEGRPKKSAPPHECYIFSDP